MKEIDRCPLVIVSLEPRPEHGEPSGIIGADWVVHSEFVGAADNQTEAVNE